VFNWISADIDSKQYQTDLGLRINAISSSFSRSNNFNFRLRSSSV